MKRDLAVAKATFKSLVRRVSLTWNTLLPSLERLALKLEELGFTYNDGIVTVTGIEEEKKDV